MKKILYLFLAMLTLQFSIQAMEEISDLEDAVFDGDAAAVSMALQSHKFNIMANNYVCGNTLLHLAAQGATEGHVNIVRMLLDAIPTDERPTFLMTPNKYGATALHHAASGWRIVQASYVNETMHADMMKNQVEIIKMLLEAMPVNKRLVFVMKPDNNKHTVLHNATYGRHANVIKMLLDSIQKPEHKAMLLKTMNGYGKTALNFAVTSFLREAAVVRVLLEYYLQLGIEIPQDLKEDRFVAVQLEDIAKLMESPTDDLILEIMPCCGQIICVNCLAEIRTHGNNICPFCKKSLH